MGLPQFRSQMQKVVRTVLIYLLIINFFYVLAGVLFPPIRSMDAIGVYLFKAKAIYLENGFPLQSLKSPDLFYSAQEYPLLLPFFFFLVYKISGGVREIYVLLLYPIIYLGILLLVYKTLRQKVSANSALLFSYFYSMLSPLLAQGGRGHAGIADIVLVLIVWIIIYLFYAKKEKNYLPVLISFLVIIASQIKKEGIFLIFPLVLLPLPRKKKALFLTLSVIPFLVWNLTVKKLNLPPYPRLAFPPLPQILPRILIIIFLSVKEMLNIKNWYIFWPVLGLSLFTKKKVGQIAKKIIIPSLSIMSVCFFSALFLTTLNLYKHALSSIDRVLFQLSPWFYMLFLEKISWGKYFLKNWQEIAGQK